MEQSGEQRNSDYIASLDHNPPSRGNRSNSRECVSRSRRLKLGDGESIRIEIARVTGGRGRFEVTTSFDPDEISDVTISVAPCEDK